MWLRKPDEVAAKKNDVGRDQQTKAVQKEMTFPSCHGVLSEDEMNVEFF